MKPKIVLKTTPKYWVNVLIYSLQVLKRASYDGIEKFLVKEYQLDENLFYEKTGKKTNKFDRIIRWTMISLVRGGIVVKESRSIFKLSNNFQVYYTEDEAEKFYNENIRK